MNFTQGMSASDLNVDCENYIRVKYDYKINDLILLDRGTLQRKLVPKRDGPYQVIRVLLDCIAYNL